MKKQKRDPEQRAFNRGYIAGIKGRSKEVCPLGHRQSWLAGWRVGRCDQWDGLMGVAGLHRLPY